MHDVIQRIFAHTGGLDGMVEIGFTDARKGLEPPHPLNSGRKFRLADLDEAVEFAAKQNANQNCNVYFSAGICHVGAYEFSRAADTNIHYVAACWVDLDAPGSLANAINIAESMALRPNLVTFTGNDPTPRGQMWWVFDEPTADLDLHRRLQMALASKFNSDPSVINPSRVMRLAGGVAWPIKAGRSLEMTGVVTDAATRPSPYTIEEFVTKMERFGGMGPAQAKAERAPRVSTGDNVLDFSRAAATHDVAGLIAGAALPGQWHRHALLLTAHVLGRGTPPEVAQELLTGSLQQPGFSYDQTWAEVGVMIGGAERRGFYKKKAGGVDPLDPKLVLQVASGQLPQSLDTVEDYLLAADVGLYQRGGRIVRVAAAPVSVSTSKDIALPQIIEVTSAALRDLLTRFIQFQRRNEKSGWANIDCPKLFADTYLSRVGKWRLPILAGLLSSPTLRSDGSILQTEGYDAATGLLFDARGVVFPEVAERPNRDDALVALNSLQTLIETFPFVDDGSRSAALAAILTSLIRRSLTTSPLFAFTAPAAGSGKSMLVDIISTIVTGVSVPVISQGASEEEMEKRLGAALIAGFELVSIDNCEAPLKGELLCQMLTQRSVRVRALGFSKLVEAPTNAMFFATGNNLVLAGDLTRRAVRVALDPQVERPELRDFANNPLEDASLNRANYVAAGLTILRAYEVAGKPTQGVKPMGSFEDWSSRVRGALLWLGEADPCSTIQSMREDDPTLDQLKSLTTIWLQVFGCRPVTVRELMVQPVDALKDILLVIAGDRDAINARKCGQWLATNKGRIVDGHKILRAGESRGVALWQIVNASRQMGSVGCVGSDQS